MIRRPRLSALPTVIAALCVLATGQPVAAGFSGELFVDDDAVYGASGCDGIGLAAFTAIQDAVDAASLANTKIRVCPGTYTGHVEIDADDPDGLVIRSTMPWKATLRPNPEEDHESLIRVAGVENTKIAWLNIELPTEEPCGHLDAAINVEGATHTIIRANHIRAIGSDTAGACAYERGIRALTSPRLLVAFNRVTDFTSTGISINETTGATVRGNTVRFNHAGVDVINNATGIDLADSPNTNVRRNVVGGPTSAGATTPRLDAGILAIQSSGSEITDNHVFRTDRGINLEATSNMIVSDNRVRFTGTFGIGLLFSTLSSNVANNSVSLGEEEGMDIQSDSAGNQVHDNDFRGNSGTDCRDVTEPGGNTWTNNLGDESDPAGLCSPT